MQGVKNRISFNSTISKFHFDLKRHARSKKQDKLQLNYYSITITESEIHTGTYEASNLKEKEQFKNK